MQDRREKNYLTVILKLIKGQEHVDREDLLGKDRERTEGHKYKPRKTKCGKDVTRLRNRIIDNQNSLDREIMKVRIIYEFQLQFDASRYGN